MSDIVDELHDTGRLVHREHYVQIKRQKLIEAANTITDLRALADDLAAEVTDLREAILNLCNDNGLEAPEIVLTDGVLARYREARQR